MDPATIETPRKICVVVASRANYARIKSVLAAIKQHSLLELQLVSSASALLTRFGEAVDVIRKDGFETMATAIAASYMNIPVAHTQGGR